MATRGGAASSSSSTGGGMKRVPTWLTVSNLKLDADLKRRHDAETSIEWEWHLDPDFECGLTHLDLERTDLGLRALSALCGAVNESNDTLEYLSLESPREFSVADEHAWPAARALGRLELTPDAVDAHLFSVGDAAVRNASAVTWAQLRPRPAGKAAAGAAEAEAGRAEPSAVAVVRSAPRRLVPGRQVEGETAAKAATDTRFMV